MTAHKARSLSLTGTPKGTGFVRFNPFIVPTPPVEIRVPDKNRQQNPVGCMGSREAVQIYDADLEKDAFSEILRKR